MTLNITDIMMVRQAVSNCALENNWDKEKEDKIFNQILSYLLGVDK